MKSYTGITYSVFCQGLGHRQCRRMAIYLARGNGNGDRVFLCQHHRKRARHLLGRVDEWLRADGSRRSPVGYPSSVQQPEHSIEGGNA